MNSAMEKVGEMEREGEKVKRRKQASSSEECPGYSVVICGERSPGEVNPFSSRYKWAG